MNDKKLDEITKVKLIYSGELLFFSLAFIVLGILELTNVIGVSETILNIFKYLALVAGGYFIFDFVTTFTNPKKKEKACLFDKFSTIFIPPYTITLSILLLTNNEVVWNNPQYFVAPLLLAIAVVYLLQAIYHWFYPLKELLEDDEEDKKETPKTDFVDFDFTEEKDKPEENN